jgi:hypothetical protein
MTSSAGSRSGMGSGMGWAQDGLRHRHRDIDLTSTASQRSTTSRRSVSRHAQRCTQASRARLQTGSQAQPAGQHERCCAALQGCSSAGPYAGRPAGRQWAQHSQGPAHSQASRSAPGGAAVRGQYRRASGAPPGRHAQGRGRCGRRHQGATRRGTAGRRASSRGSPAARIPVWWPPRTSTPLCYWRGAAGPRSCHPPAAGPI